MTADATSCSSGCKPQTHDVVAQNGVRISRRLELPPGRYQLRVGVRDGGSGATGSVLYDIEVPGLRQGAAVDERRCSSAPPTRAGSRPRTRIRTSRSVLPSQPTAIRDFPRNDQLALFTEVYDNQTKVAHRVAIKTTVIADDGKVVHTTEDERKSEELKGGKGGLRLRDERSTPRSWSPGRYVLRVEAATLLTQRRQGDARARVPDPVSTDIRTIARGDASRIVDGTPRDRADRAAVAGDVARARRAGHRCAASRLRLSDGRGGVPGPAAVGRVRHLDHRRPRGGGRARRAGRRAPATDSTRRRQRARLAVPHRFAAAVRRRRAVRRHDAPRDRRYPRRAGATRRAAARRIDLGTAGASGAL